MSKDNTSDYRGSHVAPSSDFGSPFHDVAGPVGVFPEDFYSDKGRQWYGSGYHRLDVGTHAQISSLRNKPDAMVHVFRAVPSTARHATINPGDWVTPTREYAIQHGESTLQGQYRLISKKVPAKHLWNDGNSIHEWGYDPR
jgi:hypothetical protein